MIKIIVIISIMLGIIFTGIKVNNALNNVMNNHNDKISQVYEVFNQ